MLGALSIQEDFLAYSFIHSWSKQWLRQYVQGTGFCPCPLAFQTQGGSDGKESTCNVGDLGSIPGLGRSPGERNGRQPAPVFLPGEIHGQRSLMGYSPWGCQELDMTEQLWLHFHQPFMALQHQGSGYLLALKAILPLCLPELLLLDKVCIFRVASSYELHPCKSWWHFWACISLLVFKYRRHSFHVPYSTGILILDCMFCSLPPVQ